MKTKWTRSSFFNHCAVTWCQMCMMTVANCGTFTVTVSCNLHHLCHICLILQTFWANTAARKLRNAAPTDAEVQNCDFEKWQFVWQIIRYCKTSISRSENFKQRLYFFVVLKSDSCAHVCSHIPQNCTVNIEHTPFQGAPCNYSNN